MTGMGQLIPLKWLHFAKAIKAIIATFTSKTKNRPLKGTGGKTFCLSQFPVAPASQRLWPRLGAGCTNAQLTIWLANRGLILTAHLTRCRVARSAVN